MEWLKIYYPILSVGYIGLIIVTAHLVASRQYSWANNTISDLGAQGYNRRWIMRMGFIGFGLIMIGGIFIKIIDRDILYLVDIPVLLYAFAILLTGIFSTEPFIEGQPFNETVNVLHTIFAMTAGVAIVIALLMSALLANSQGLRILHVAFLILIILITGFLGFRKKHNGIIQRILYITTFTWLIVLYNL